MLNNSSNVSTGKPKVTGAIFAAVAGTAIPSDATTPLTDDYKNLGYIHEDGVTNAVETDSESIKAWGGDTVDETQTSYDETFQFIAIETNEATLKEYYGPDNVEISATAMTVKHTSEELPEHPWAIETVLKGGRVQRTVIPKGKITERGEVVFKDDEAIGYSMTIKALPDADGATAYTHIATPAT